MQILAALLLDAFIGDPKRLPHPVKLVGRLIIFYESIFYQQDGGKIKGAAFCASVLATVAAIVALITLTAQRAGVLAGTAVNIYLIYAALAFKSLKDESFPIKEALADRDLKSARAALGRIVGRDTELLDEHGVIRATVETIAESYIDGIVSVLFWTTAGFFLGYPAVFAWLFKAVSTMDSMVGYDNERYRNFGWAAAKLDDILNFIPARLGAVIAILGGALAGMDYRRAWRIFLRDRLCHKSPNSAHGESVFAGLLGIRLGGGAFYGGEWEARPTLGDDTRPPEPCDISYAHRILNVSTALCAVLIFALI